MDNTTPQVFTIDELAAHVDASAHLRPQGWLPWVLDPELATLEFDGYQVDLEQMVDSAHVLDRIFQVADKSWATSLVIAALVRAIGDLLHPQTTLCSGGKNLTSTRQEALDRVQAAAAEYHVS